MNSVPANVTFELLGVLDVPNVRTTFPLPAPAFVVPIHQQNHYTTTFGPVCGKCQIILEPPGRIKLP